MFAGKGIPFVIDGTFNFKRWRVPVYESLLRNNFSNIVIVRCFCEDTDIVRARIEDRQLDKIRPENEASKMENYLKTTRENEPVYEDKLPEGKISVVEFNTGSYSIRITQNPCRYCQNNKRNHLEKRPHR